MTSVLETCLYVDDLDRARKFYRDLFDFPVLLEDNRLCVMAVADGCALILFLRGASKEPIQLPGGVIPPHDGSGTTHFAFSIRAEDLEAWRGGLSNRGILVESEVRWPLGGTSLYFRDPDAHVVELATPGIWDFEGALRGRE